MKAKKLSILLFVTLFLGLFFWFQIKPAQIKHDCSWVKVHDNATPASPGVTSQEVEASKKDHPECNNIGARDYDTSILCWASIKNYQAPQPAQPARNWWREASTKEYQFCLHDKGL